MSRLAPHFCTLLVVSLVSAFASRAAERPWQLLETPRFRIVSQLSERDTRTWAGEFSLFIEELRSVITIDPAQLPPVTVVMFARDRDFSRYKPLRPDGKRAAAAAGLFNSTESWSVISFAEGEDDDDTRHLIQHEAVHWFMSADPRRHPPWFGEGLAEVFSTFRADRDNVHWGDAIPRHVTQLRQTALLPFERLLFVTRDDPLFNESNRTSIFYAQSWLFVHYVLFGRHEGSRKALGDYLTQLDDGAEPEAAFRAAFGFDYKSGDRLLARYLDHGTYFRHTRPLQSAPRDEGELTRAPPHMVEDALARLAYCSRRYSIAREHAERTIAVAPAQPLGHEMRALLDYEAGNTADALAAGRRALELGSSDARTIFLVAYLQTNVAQRVGIVTPSEAREIADLYHRTIQLRRGFTQAYKNLAGLASVLEQVRPEDHVVLRTGARLFPDDGEILVGLASLVAREGDRPAALRVLQEALRRQMSLEMRTFVERLQEQWTFEEGMAGIEALLAAEKFTEVPAVCDALAEKVTSFQARLSLTQVRSYAAAREKLQLAEAAQQAGSQVEARGHYAELLEMADIPASVRNVARERLQALPRE